MLLTAAQRIFYTAHSSSYNHVHVKLHSIVMENDCMLPYSIYTINLYLQLNLYVTNDNTTL